MRLTHVLAALACAFILSTPAFADTTIPNLSAAGAAADADLVPTSQSGGSATKQTLTAIWTWIQSHLASPGPIGATTPAAGSFTSLSGSSLVISGSTVTLSGVTSGTQTVCLGLTAGGNIVTSSGACGSGGSGIQFTDGTHTVSGATQLTVTGGTVGGSSPNATLAISATPGGSSNQIQYNNGGSAFGGLTQLQARNATFTAVDQITEVANASFPYQMLATDFTVTTKADYAAANTVTLPPSANVNTGLTVKILDQAQKVTAVNTLTVAANGSDTVTGTTVINAAGGQITCQLDKGPATPNWTCYGSIPNGATGTVLAGQGTGTAPNYTNAPVLGSSGVAGSITMGNNTSGTYQLQPPAGVALGSDLATLPVPATGSSVSIAGLNAVQAWSQPQTFNTGNLQFKNAGGGATTLAGASSASNFIATFPAAADQVVELSTTDTLTNKTISGSSNTLTNIGNSSLTNSSTTVSGQTCTLGSTCAIPIMWAGDGISLTSNSTKWNGGFSNGAASTEANAQMPAPKAFTFSNLNVHLSSDPGNGNTLVVTLRDNTTSESVTCTVTGNGSNGQSCSDSIHTFTGAAQDLIDVQLTTSATFTASFVSWSMLAQ